MVKKNQYLRTYEHAHTDMKYWIVNIYIFSWPFLFAFFRWRVVPWLQSKEENKNHSGCEFVTVQANEGKMNQIFFGWKSKGSNSIAAENLLHTKNLVSKSKWLVRASCATLSMHTHWILRMLVQRYEHFFSLFVRCWFCFTFSQKEAQRKKVTIRSNATKIYFQMGRGRETVIVVVR